MFRRILVANRGEIAVRIIRACRALGIETVAIHSEADSASPHLRNATRTLCIGPGRSADSYLNMDAVLEAALITECQAIHPGYGFLSENALFASRCRLQKTTFIGPPPGAIALMGNKARAKHAMNKLGLPTIPGSEGVVASAEEAARIAADIGYPVLLKASAGGGGKGMRVVASPARMAGLFAEASLEAEKAFSDPALYLEKIIEHARHIEFQVLIDAYGHAVHLGERECSLQRHHQKLVEEAPSPALAEADRNRIGRMVASALAASGYTGAGTVEFLRDSDGAFYFMEVNARLQVEHPVTEMVTGIDLVQMQIRIAANEPMTVSQEAIKLAGHALELRINAEDPDDGFRPDPGQIRVWTPPVPGLDPGSAPDLAPGVSQAASAADVHTRSSSVSLRLDSHVEEGYTVPAFYDSLLGKLILHAPDRPTLLAAAAAAVGAFRIEGVKTTLPLHARILESPAFRSGNYDLDTLGTILAAVERSRG